MLESMTKLLLSCLTVVVGGAAYAGSLSPLRKAFVRVAALSYASDDDLARRFIAYSDYGRANDVLQLQLYTSVHLPGEEVERLLGLMDERGCWRDIDYTDQTRGRWQPTLHLTRLQALAKLWAAPDSEYVRDPRLCRALHAGIGCWLRLDPRCPNWWHNEIGVPKKLATVLLMLGDEASPDEVAGGVRILDRSPFGRTGQNRVWLAGNNLMKGLLTDDEELVARARDTIASEICLTTGEGIQSDWSYHQHGPQLQFGNYGLAYAESLSFWFRVLEETPYAFSDAAYGILRRLLTDGIARSVWRGILDPNFCGRQVFPDAGRGKALSLAVTARNLAAIERPGSREFSRLADRILFPARREGGMGPRYYWRSDCGIYRARRWYASVRMHSERTVGFEMTNRENLLANFSADGALLTMQHGAEYENIFACWDWRRIPGTTAYDDGLPIRSSDAIPEKRNRTRRVGGLAADGMLCTTMELCRDSLRALKSNFFFGRWGVALGCGIRSLDPAHRTLFTTLEQNRLRGDVTVGSADRVFRFGKEVPTARNFPSGTVRWVHHDKRGYLLLDGPDWRLSTVEQSGKWDPIDPSCRDCSDSARIFKCWIEHRRDCPDRYAYVLLPGRSAKRTARLAEKCPVQVLRNDTLCQAVRLGRRLCAVFHAPGVLSNGDFALRVDAPAVLLFDCRNNRLTASSSTARSLNAVLRKGNRRLSAAVTFPQGEADRGKTVGIRFKKQKP